MKVKRRHPPEGLAPESRIDVMTLLSLLPVFGTMLRPSFSSGFSLLLIVAIECLGRPGHILPEEPVVSAKVLYAHPGLRILPRPRHTDVLSSESAEFP